MSVNIRTVLTWLIFIWACDVSVFFGSSDRTLRGLTLVRCSLSTVFAHAVTDVRGEVKLLDLGRYLLDVPVGKGFSCVPDVDIYERRYSKVRMVIVLSYRLLYRC